MPVTATPPGWVASCTVEAVTVVAFKGSDSWATGAAVTLIPVAPSGGVTVTTVGAVVSAGAVVKVLVAVAARRFPAGSAMPVGPPRSWRRYPVLGVSALVGVKVIEREVLS